MKNIELCFLDELEHAVRLSKPKIIFTTPNGVDISTNVSKRNEFLKTVVVLLDDKAKFGDAISVNDFIGKFKVWYDFFLLHVFSILSRNDFL